jgi:hypothetical protein
MCIIYICTLVHTYHDGEGAASGGVGLSRSVKQQSSGGCAAGIDELEAVVK